MKTPASLPWRRLRTLAGGGQSRVFVVAPTEADQFPEREYALKELRRPDRRQALARFVREIEAIKRVSHPGVVRVIDHSAEQDEYQYYVMPLYEGAQSLAEVAFGTDSPFLGQPKATLLFVAQCASALYEAHRKQIVHRDIKPENILVMPDLSPVIIDFGCCHVADGAMVTLTDEGVGAKNYMAPECEAGAEGDVSVRSDVYSLGKVMWATVTGQRAFARESPGFSNKAIEKMLPDRPEAWHLTELMKQSVRRDPKERFGNMNNFGKECERYAQQVVGQLLPMALVRHRCPMCGSSEVVGSKTRVEEPRVDIGLLVGATANHPDLEGWVCRRCGFVFLRNSEPYRTWLEERRLLEQE